MADFHDKLKNPHKYNGTRPIIMRSKYEKDFALKLDLAPNIKFWNSEDITIKYKFPFYMKHYRIKRTKINKTRIYYIDFMYITTDNKTRLIEIKNMDLLKKPVSTGNNKKGYNFHLFHYKKNLAKFEEARLFCESFTDIDIQFFVTSGYNFDLNQ